MTADPSDLSDPSDPSDQSDPSDPSDPSDGMVGPTAEADPDGPADPEGPADPDAPTFQPTPIPDDRGEVLFYEPGGSWLVVAIGPILIAAVLIMEIVGPGQVHWLIIGLFGLIVTGFSIIQVIAARRHVTVELTERTLQQGTRLLALDDIEEIYPAGHGGTHHEWESAPALGELHGVPRRRKGVGVKLASGAVAQAWARDVERFRNELIEAHLAVRLGLPPRGADDPNH